MSVNKEVIDSVSSLNSLESENISEVITTLQKNNQLTENFNDLLFKYNELKHHFYQLKNENEKNAYNLKKICKDLSKSNLKIDSFKNMSFYLLNVLLLVIVTKIFF